MKRAETGRGLFYTRDSGGRHEMTPGQYVEWAAREATKRGVSFAGTHDVIESLIRNGSSHHGDVFLDFDICGNLLSRPGLNGLLAEIKNDLTVSHIFIPRRDRLARPDDPLDVLLIENSLRKGGLWLVFMDRVLSPIAKGQRPSVEDLLGGVIDYARAGKDRTDLAQKIIYAQIALAKDGYSTGGRPPYGFRRWLVTDDGVQIRELAEGERVRQRGRHVVWLPGPECELEIIRRILALLTVMPATAVARLLTKEGVPSPDAGRTRTDNGIKHRTSGAWNQTTIVNIARHPMLRAICAFGRRSMGDQLRFTTNGPRPLTDSDFRSDGKPKIIRNPDEATSRAPAWFKALVNLEEHRELIAILDERGKSQRGKPRSRDPSKNPLGSRVFDMNCGWPMYRTPYGKTFRYSCGAYMQTQQCDHNHVDGPTATRFVLSCLRQKLVSPSALEKLKRRLRDLAAAERPASPDSNSIAVKQSTLAKVQADLARVQRNLALADNPEQYRAMASVFEELRQQEAALDRQISAANKRPPLAFNADAEVAAALTALDRLGELAADNENLAKIGDAFRLVNVRVFLKFNKVQVKKRALNKQAGGIVTFGDTPPPVPLYAGPTGRRAIEANTTATVAAGSGGLVALPNGFGSGREGKSLGNVSRGDRI